MSILRHANVGEQQHAVDAETTPLRNPELYRYDLDLRDIAELWRRGSVIASWLLDLTAAALAKDPALTNFAGKVSDSGEGRWTIKAAIDEAVPVPVLSTALMMFSARAAKRRLATSCCRPCATNSADIWRNQCAERKHETTGYPQCKPNRWLPTTVPMGVSQPEVIT